MRIYMSGVKRAWRDDCEGHFLLVSYAEPHERSLLAEGWNVRGWLLDSGAFSAWRRDMAIDIHAYCLFVQDHEQHLDGYIALDVIGDSEGSWRNYEIMRDLYGLDPLPVYHEGDPIRHLDRYVQMRAGKPIALGATVSRGRPEILDWLIPLFQRHPQQAFHGLAMTQERIIRWLPFVSVDSTSWLNFNRYGVEGGKYLLKERSRGFYRRLGIAALEDIPACPPNVPPAYEGQLLMFQREVQDA